MRLNEIVNLRWENVDLNKKIITVGDEIFVTKGRKQRFIPISDEALTSILSQRERRRAIPIGNSIGQIRQRGREIMGKENLHLGYESLLTINLTLSLSH